MLDKLRSTVNSWPAKILLCLILLSFIAWGGHSAFERSGDTVLLTSDDNSADAALYDMTLRNEILRLSMRSGHYLTPEEIKNFRLNDVAYSILYNNILLDNGAQKLHLDSSDKNVADFLTHDSFFTGADGQFDISSFNFYLQNLRVKREEFLNNFYVKAAQRNQIIATLQEGTDAPDTFYKALTLYQKQTRDIDYVVLTPAAVGTIAEPDSTTLFSWFKFNGDKFRTPEYRQVSYISLTADDIIPEDKINAAEVEAYYQAHKKQYLENPEKRSFKLIRFADKASAEKGETAIREAIESGVSAEKAFEQASFKTEYRHSVAQETLPTLLGTEIFALQKATISRIINDLQGPVLIYVTEIEPEKLKPLSAVAEEIRHNINSEKAKTALPDYRKKIEDSRFDGASLKDIAAQYHLTLHTVILDKNGNTPLENFADFPQSSTLLPHIFTAAENVDTDPLTLNSGGYLWYNVDTVAAPRFSALEEVHHKALAVWKEEQLQQKLDARATELAKELNAGGDFSALAQKNSLTLQHINKLVRSPEEKILSQQAISAVFSAVQGESGLSMGLKNDTRIIFRINKITEPQLSDKTLLSEAEKSNIASTFRTDMVALYLRAQASQTPIRVNKTVYEGLTQAEY